MKAKLLSFLLAIIPIMAFSQVPIDQSNYTVVFVSSDNTNHPVADAFDGDPATWWALYNENGWSLPGIVEVDLGTDYDIAGFSYLPNAANPGNKAIEYEIYTSNDGVNWGNPEAGGEFPWTDPSDVSPKEVFFGAVTARYIRVEYLSSTAQDDNIHTGELVFFEDPGAATGQQNQVITFDPIPTKTTDDDPFQLIASSNSGLPITFEVVSGPATVAGDILTLDGVAGTVVVKALQVGNGTYYPSEKLRSFEVLDLSTYFPEVFTHLSDSYPLEMNSLMAYPVYASATIEHPEFIQIDHIEIEHDGQTFSMDEEEGFFHYLWTPSSFSTQNVTITAYGTNGNSTSVIRQVDVVSSASNQTVTTMDDVVIWFGQQNSRWFYGDFSVPQFLGTYENITANLIVECPSGDCDDWDRLAYIDIKAPDGNWIQLIRYITPYGVGCNHSIDISDYASLLQGDIELRMFIDTWGTGGWQITLDLVYDEGAPEYLYSSVKEAWDANYNFGDLANLQPVPQYNHIFHPDVEEAYLRLSTTGHGWGQNNTGNAAEFFHAMHNIEIAGSQAFIQDLWNFCNPNPDGCTGQQGTWWFPRAGWCPGAIAHPNEFDLGSYINPNTTAFNYIFHPGYIDLCHPNNPNCVPSGSCDCNAGFNPFYVVDGQIISFADVPLIYDNTLSVDSFDIREEVNIILYPNPADSFFKLNVGALDGKIKMTIFGIDGSQIRVFYFDDANSINQTSFDTAALASGNYFIRVENNRGQVGVKKLIVR